MEIFKDNSCSYIGSMLDQVRDALQSCSQISINSLLQNNDYLMLFSDKLDNKDFYNSALWNICDNKLYTNNIMGFIGFDTCNIKITSRFTQGQKDFFLHYMLQKVFLGAIINLDTHTNNEDSVWDFYHYLFPYYLNRALNIGIYKEYIHKKHNNINVKGTVDIKRHTRNNIPFLGKIAYNTKERSFNNRIIQLIRHTIEYLSQKQYSSQLLNCNLTTRENIENIKYFTCDYHYSERNSVIHSCLESIGNPYWQDYEVLRKLCIKILTQEKLSFYGKEDRVHGILFDGAWLWEEYLATFLPSDFIHPDNKRGINSIYLAESNKLPRYPDFYSKDEKIVLDAKYKYAKEDRRDDIHQILAYMYRLKAMQGSLIYPSEDNNIANVTYTLNGYGNELKYIFHKIANEENDYKLFCNKMIANEESFIQALNVASKEYFIKPKLLYK